MRKVKVFLVCLLSLLFIPQVSSAKEKESMSIAILKQSPIAQTPGGLLGLQALYNSHSAPARVNMLRDIQRANIAETVATCIQCKDYNEMRKHLELHTGVLPATEKKRVRSEVQKEWGAQHKQSVPTLREDDALTAALKMSRALDEKNKEVEALKKQLAEQAKASKLTLQEDDEIPKKNIGMEKLKAWAAKYGVFPGDLDEHDSYTDAYNWLVARFAA